MRPIEIPNPPHAGAGEAAWSQYAHHLRELLVIAETARAAARKAANQRSTLLNRLYRYLTNGDAQSALRELEHRERARPWGKQ